MTSRAAVDDFLSRQTLAVVGVSRQGNKFGNVAFKELKAKGYTVLPVNPHAETIEGERCYPDLQALPEGVEGVLIVVPPSETEKVVRQAAEAGIRDVWLQQGAESEEAIRFCEEQGLGLVHGHCILMFAEPTGLGHRLHRWVWGLLGKLPA
ncbi:MAG: CoA-binding protein [Anaerolineae bacterium]|jgi:predicted CoA-binding protein